MYLSFKNLLTLAFYQYASLGGNPDLCQSVSCEKKKKKMLVIPLVATSIVVLVLLFLFCAWRICRRKRRGIYVFLELFSGLIIFCSNP